MANGQSPTLLEADLDKLFCMNSKKYGVEKVLLKAVAMVESSMKPVSYRFEEAFWEKYLKNNPEWKDRDPKEVSASYGLMQLMYTTAWMLGFRGSGEDLYNPVYNIELGAKLIRKLFDELRPQANCRAWPLEVVLARYNGGSWMNPGPDGSLRNSDYVARVKRAYWNLRMLEDNCA